MKKFKLIPFLLFTWIFLYGQPSATLNTLSTNGVNSLQVSGYTVESSGLAAFTMTHVNTGNTSNGYMSFVRGTSTSGGFLKFGTSGSDRLTINASGYVGIGTTLPNQLLDIENSNSSYSFRIGNNAGYGYNIGRSPITGYMQFFGDQTGMNGYSFGGVNGTKMTIDNVGNVGIGTTNPKAKLDIGSFIDNGQTGTVLGRLSEGNPTGDGTYLGVVGYSTICPAGTYNTKSFSIEHHFYGQTNSSINFFRGGGETGGFITFNTSNNTEKMRIDDIGNIGIGTSTPGAKLDVRGNIYINSGIDDNHIFWGGHNMTIGTPVGEYAHNIFSLEPGGASNGPLYSEFNMVYSKSITKSDHETRVHISTAGNTFFNGGNVGIGTDAPNAKLEVHGTTTIGQYTNGTAVIDAYNSYAYFGCNTTPNGIAIGPTGSVGIGTATPNPLYLLDVKGTIRATEVKIVSVDNFPDFVFDPEYKLPSLGQVSSFIQTNKHLPNIPSASDVKENGINMVEMQNKLLQKVEELTLYVIEQQKRIEQLEKNQK
ncbi:MAG: hypothetical protein PHR83_04400 [Paludibacter sp.]|nr:hypothetical protein [Paludibacter sp.]